jgi:hypothetical protein
MASRSALARDLGGSLFVWAFPCSKLAPQLSLDEFFVRRSFWFESTGSVLRVVAVPVSVDATRSEVLFVLSSRACCVCAESEFARAFFPRTLFYRGLCALISPSDQGRWRGVFNLAQVYLCWYAVCVCRSLRSPCWFDWEPPFCVVLDRLEERFIFASILWSDSHIMFSIRDLRLIPASKFHVFWFLFDPRLQNLFCCLVNLQTMLNFIRSFMYLAWCMKVSCFVCFT